MEVEKESLLKLKKLEAQLVEIIEAVDKEINQVDVEWLNLRSIALAKIQEQNPNTPENKPGSQIKIEKIVNLVKGEFRDGNYESMQLNLAVNSKVNQNVDEEFDSD